MKKVFLALLSGGLLMASCSKQEVEIAEQNNAYKLDQNVIHVDMPEKLNYEPSNLIRRNEVGTEITIYGAVEEERFVLSEEAIELNFTLRKPLKAPIKIVLEEDSKLLEQYTSEKVGLVSFPEDVFSTKEILIPAGVTTHNVSIPFLNKEKLNRKPGFLSAFHLKVKEGADEIKVVKSSQVLFLKLSIETNE